MLSEDVRLRCLFLADVVQKERNEEGGGCKDLESLDDQPCGGAGHETSLGL